MIICGIDPGLSGALAFFDPATPAKIAVADMPVCGGEIDAGDLARALRRWSPDLAVLERVAAMPTDGRAVAFRFGRAVGVAQGVLGACGVPHREVTPAVWKRHLGLGSDKEASRRRAIDLWPESAHFSRKRDHNRAEASLIARYGAEVLLRVAEAA